MKKVNYLLLFALICAFAYIIRVEYAPSVEADVIFTTAQAGSALDPIITKSYLDKRLAELEMPQEESNYLKYKVVELKKDKMMLFGEGTEFILRAGNMVVYDKTTNGIADLSDGDTKFHDMEVHKNHHMLNPRNDGRGVLAKSDCFLMVKGDYKVAE